MNYKMNITDDNGERLLLSCGETLLASISTGSDTVYLTDVWNKDESTEFMVRDFFRIKLNVTANIEEIEKAITNKTKYMGYFFVVTI